MRPGKKDDLTGLLVAVVGMLLACAGCYKQMEMLTCLGLGIAAIGVMMDS